MFKKHFLNFAIISFLIFAAWNKILSHTMLGEGYYYFFQGYSQNGTILRYDIGAGLLFDVIKPFFKDNFFLYQGLELSTYIVISLLFYLFVFEFTQSRKISLIAGILFGVNFSTSFEMFGYGAYQNFGQRIFFLLLLFPSFILYFKFKKNKEKKYYLLGLILCITSAFFANFNLFYIAFLPAYILALLCLERFNIKKIFTEILLVSPYFLLSLLVIYIPIFVGSSSYLQKQNLLLYLTSNFNEIVFYSLRQLVILTIPDMLLRLIFSVFSTSYKDAIPYLFIPILLLYTVVGVLVYKKEKKLRVPLVTSILFMCIVFFLNMFMRSDNVNHLESGSRYLFAPSIGFAIFWSLFLALFYKKLGNIFLYMGLFIWFFIQVVPIHRELNGEAYKHTETKKIIAYMKQISPKLKDDSIVITPRLMGYWGTDFLRDYYGKKGNLFIPRLTPQMVWTKDFKRPFNPKTDVILYYDEDNEKVIDITKDYNKIIINNDLSQ